MPAAVMHKSRKEEEFNIPKSQDRYEGIGDNYLQVDVETPESPYDETTSIERDGGEVSPVWAPLGQGKKGVSKRVAEMRVDEVIPASPGVVTPITATVPLTPITPITPVTLKSPSNVPSPVLTPTAAVIQLSPAEVEVPMIPVPVTPITPLLADTRPSSPTRSTPNTPVPTTPTPPIYNTSTYQEPGRHLDHGDDRHRHHHRNPEETSDERRKRKERDHAKREKGTEERRLRHTQNGIVEKEDTWLEVVFEDLPFGPDQNMSRAMASIKRDYKIFIAEIIALVGVAYVIQRSGW